MNETPTYYYYLDTDSLKLYVLEAQHIRVQGSTKGLCVVTNPVPEVKGEYWEDEIYAVIGKSLFTNISVATKEQKRLLKKQIALTAQLKENTCTMVWYRDEAKECSCD